MSNDYLNISFRDGSAQFDYAISSKNSLLLGLVALEALCVGELGLPIDDIRAIIDEEKTKLEAKPLSEPITIVD